MVLKGRARRLLFLLGGPLVASVVLMAGTSTASAALFSQCPPVGSNLGCSQLVTINKDGTATVQTDPAAPANGYDGAEDTLIGIQNNSGRSISSVNLASTTRDIFAFDGDGLCNPAQWPSPLTKTTPPGCPGIQGFGTSGYEGPGTSFTNISSNKLTGTLNFTPALASGSSRYFALEEALQSGQLRSAQSGPIPGPITHSGRTVRFDLTCVGAANCAGKVRLVIRTKNGQVVRWLSTAKGTRLQIIGAISISISSGRTVNLVVSPNKSGKQLLRRLRHRNGFTTAIRVVINGQTYTVGTVHLS
jgi:hypothetical protein